MCCTKKVTPLLRQWLFRMIYCDTMLCKNFLDVKGLSVTTYVLIQRHRVNGEKGAV